MPNLRNLWNRLTGAPKTHENELDEEMAFHLEMKERELRAAGRDPKQAAIEARRAIGNATRFREDAREAWTFTWLRDAIRDIQFGARSLAAQPGFAVAALLALVLGIGINAIVFNVYNALVFASFAVRDPGNTVNILTERGPGRWHGFSWPHYRYIRDNTKTMSGLAASDMTGVRITRGDVSWSGRAIAASDNYFDVLGTGFASGRGFLPITNPREPEPEIVLHYDTWLTRFGGDPNTVGQWIEVNGHRMQVVGIAAQGFNGPNPSSVELWVAGPWRDIFHPDAKTYDTPNSCCVSILGRLRPGATSETVRAEVQTLSAQFTASIKRESGRVLVTGVTLLSNPTQYNKSVPFFIAIGTASLLILLLACANVGNLQLARTLGRYREISVRLSLGASRWRILRQLFAESLVLSSIAGAVTLLLAAWAPRWIIQAMSTDATELAGIRFQSDWRVLLFIAGVTMASSVIFGMLPALGTIRAAALSDGLRSSDRSATSERGGQRLRAVLLCAQVALCAILLSGAALLVRAMEESRRADPGFRYQDVVLMNPRLESSGIDNTQAPALLAPLQHRIEGLPGVLSVARTSVVPLGNSFDGTSLPDPNSKQDRIMAGYSLVSANFFDTLGVALVAGRPFIEADEGRQDSIIVSEALAKRLYPNDSAIGKTVPFMNKTVEIIGVSRNFNIRELGPVRDLQIFAPSRGTRVSAFLVRHSGGDAAGLIASLPKIARELNRKFLATAAPYEQSIERARRAALVGAYVASGLGALGLLLACVGIYSVAAYNVTQRTREIGIRLALGARSKEVLRLVMGQSLRTVFLGAILGIAGAMFVARAMTALLFGVKPTDPAAMLGATMILLGTALLSTLVPARKATSVDPAITLRHD
jgi:predicted permease